MTDTECSAKSVCLLSHRRFYLLLIITAKFCAMEGTGRYEELTTFLREREGRPVNTVHQGYATACAVAGSGIPSWVVYSSWLPGAHSRVEKD